MASRTWKEFAMEQISTCRAAYLTPFSEVLREIGAPVERMLARAKLPTLLEETPDERISNVLASKFVEDSARQEGIGNLGWLAARRYSNSTLSKDLLTILSSLPTVRARLDRFAVLSHLESSEIRVGIVQSGANSEIYCDYTEPDKLVGLQNFDWTQVMVLIQIVRSIMGKAWTPDTISFKSNFSVCNAAREAHPNTRFLRNSKHTSITLPSLVLSNSAASKLPIVSLERLEVPFNYSSNDYKYLLRPYLRERAPKLEMFAEIIGKRPRTLQRNFQEAGFSYSELIETTRFEMAIEMLKDFDAPLIDIAMNVGYENQSNFGRSFKRISGMSPGAYRHQVLGQEQSECSGAI